MKRLAIIPARGGSKRIINKNIRNFCGRPIIAYVLEEAKKSNLFSMIHVSTESDEITRIVTGLGYPPDFPRPDCYSDDYEPIMSVLRFVVREYSKRGQIYDEVWLLMACSPLVDVQDLKGAANLFRNMGGVKPVLSVAEYSAPIQWAFKMVSSGELVPVRDDMFSTRSQDLEKHYFDAGCFSIFPTSFILESEGAGSYSDFIGYLLPKGSAIDIDDLHDWELAESIYRGRNSSLSQP